MSDQAQDAHAKVSVHRYSVLTRINHWTLAASFVLLSLSGLAFYHPSLFWLTSLFGGGATARWLHPVLGCVLMVAWLFMFLRYAWANLPERTDWVWLIRIRDVLSGHEERLPEVGKYNAGQKVVFWTFSLLVPGLFLTGLISWQEYFGPMTTVQQKEWAILIHAVMAIAMITVWIAHFYAALWVRGTVQGMTQGYVTGGWAWRHHRKWLRDLVSRRKGTPPTAPAE